MCALWTRLLLKLWAGLEWMHNERLLVRRVLNILLCGLGDGLTCTKYITFLSDAPHVLDELHNVQ